MPSKGNKEKPKRTFRTLNRKEINSITLLTQWKNRQTSPKKRTILPDKLSTNKLKRLMQLLKTLTEFLMKLKPESTSTKIKGSLLKTTSRSEMPNWLPPSSTLK
jgi:hypothetical protein